MRDVNLRDPGGQYRPQNGTLNDAMEELPSSPETAALAQTLRRQVSRAVAEGNFVAAEAVLSQLQEIAPHWADTRGLELEIRLKSGRLDEAGVLVPQLLALFPQSAKIHFLAGLFHYKSRRYAQARPCFEESGKLHPFWGTSRYLAKTLSQMASTRDEAEAILLPLARQHPECWIDLAWVYQQKQDIERAVEATERYLEVEPQNEFARSRLQSLKAKLLDPGDVQAEVELLLELGEPVSNELLGSYFEALLKTGQMQRARDFFAAQARQLSGRAATGIGWVAYQLKAHDLAVDWFLLGLDDNRRDFKFFSALEKAAELSGKGDAVLRAYKERIPADVHFHGHIKRLQKRLDRQAEEA